MTELESLRLEVERLRLLKSEHEAQVECLLGMIPEPYGVQMPTPGAARGDHSALSQIDHLAH